jgi:manganese/zinc/iron transport system permease protein
VRRLQLLMDGLLVLAIVLGLQMVGVVLMSALVVAPAAAARQWTRGLGGMVFLGAGFGATAGVVGAMVSATAPGIPTGPVIVLVVSGMVAVSLLFAPRRGRVGRRLAERSSVGDSSPSAAPRVAGTPS